MFWNRKRQESELEKELRFHIERQTEDLIALGVEPAEARRRARLAFGGPEQIKEACRDERRGRWWEDFLRDCQYGLRILRRSPAFTAAAVLSLALGIGANTAIFSLMDLVMFRMMPVREPERLVQFQKIHPEYGRGAISYPQFEQFQKELQSFEGLLAQSSLGRRDIRIGGKPETASVDLVSESYFSVLGVTAAAGRMIDGDADRRPVAVISYGYWKRQFGSNPGAIGGTFLLNQTIFTIIGVAPPEFFGTTVGQAPEIMVPLAMDGEARGGNSMRRQQHNNWLSMMGRLRAGVGIDQAQAEVATVFARMAAADAEQSTTEFYRKAARAVRVELQPAGNGFDQLRYRFSEPLRILMGVVALVLLIACANIANLLLAKSAARRREIAVRLSLGAGRGRLVRQLLTEGMLLSLLGGALGVALAYVLGNGLVTMMSNGAPRMALHVRPDARVLAFACLASLLAALVFSLPPAIQATRVSFQPALAEMRAGRWRLGKGIIVAQVALSLVLLIAAGLFGRTLLNMYSLDAGFNRHDVLIFSTNLGKLGYRGERLLETKKRIVEELQTLPGVSSASLAMLLPLSGGGWDGGLAVEGYTYAPDEDDKSHLNEVGPHYFRTLGSPVLLGREFDERDSTGSPKVAVVNETFARFYFKGASPVGKWISRNGGRASDHIEIVGMVKDAKYNDLRRECPRTVYFAALQNANAPDWHSFLVRTGAPAAAMTPAAGAALERVDKSLRVEEAKSLEEHVSRSLLTERMLAALAGFFSAVAAGLACVGIYGVMAFQVTRRRKEIGIRLALGASPGRETARVLGEAARLVAAGGAIGLAGATLSTRIAEKFLFGVRQTDPLTYAMATAGLALLALAAAYLPGRSAANHNPVDTLRCD